MHYELVSQLEPDPTLRFIKTHTHTPPSHTYTPIHTNHTMNAQFDTLRDKGKPGREPDIQENFFASVSFTLAQNWF